jgi:beta-alanine degradation protein BauB
MNFKAVYRVALVWLCAMACVRAQDPTQAAPRQYTHGPENKYVKVVYIHYAPHSKSPMHEHPAGVVVNVSDGHLRFTEADGKTHDISALRGEARYFPATKHMVENLADTPYDGVYIEIKSAPAVSSLKNGMREEDRVMQALLLASTTAKGPQLSRATAAKLSGAE